MVELKSDRLVFSFPEVHPQAVLRIEFKRTLRIPDDGRTYPLPPGLGRFPVRHVDDHAATVPPHWLDRGGVMLPLYQSEALWVRFECPYLHTRSASYPFAIKVAAGKINAVTGQPWSDGIQSRPQDYLVAPRQPWLDGFCVRRGQIRQFVAMPLGAGYSAEEQITGEAEHGGLQIVVYPIKADVFERRFPVGRKLRGVDVRRCSPKPRAKGRARGGEMGLAPGGLMKQEIYQDTFGLDDWDLEHRGRCFVHLTNSLVWRKITGTNPPTVPPTAKQYTKAGLPWFDYYDETPALAGSQTLADLKSVADLGQEKGDVPLPENEPVTPEAVKTLRAKLRKGQVREGHF